MAEETFGSSGALFSLVPDTKLAAIVVPAQGNYLDGKGSNMANPLPTTINAAQTAGCVRLWLGFGISMALTPGSNPRSYVQ